jgi:hypothetical protein
MRSMADRWKRATTPKNAGNGTASRSALDSVTSLRDDLVGSVSDTEDIDQNINHSAKSAGAGIVRPKSAAAGQNPAVMDANSRASAKTFVMKSLQPESDGSIVADMEHMSLQSEEKKTNHGGAVALLRAVSTRSRSKARGAPSSRGPSPVKNEISQFVEGEKGASHTSHQHQHLFRHESKPKQSKHSAYLAKLLLEAPHQPTLAPTSALLWGRKTPVPPSTDQIGESSHRTASEKLDIESQQAGTGLVRALHQFTAVEVLDGPNSFACKRCWRLLNPPTAEEKHRLRMRRMRRGRDESESERSSDDDPSSSDEKEEHIMADSLSLHSSTDSKPSRPAVTPHTDWNKTVTPHSINQQNVPAIETSGPESPTSKIDQRDSSDTVQASPSRAPLLKAPRAVVASSKGLTLGESFSGASSDEGLSDGAPDEVEDLRAPSVTFEDQQGKTANSRTSLPMAIKPNAPSVMRKRSTHSLQRRALKRFLIANTPRVLVFHFKRFQASSRGFSSYSFSSSFKKIDDYVSFPEYLDVKPWLAPPREEYSQSGHLKKSSDARALAKAQLEDGHEVEKGHHKWGWKHHRHATKEEREVDQQDADAKTKYRLYAVVVHQGSMSGGHYTAYVLSDRIDDGTKSRVASDTLSNTPTANATPSTPGLSNGEAGKSLSNDASVRSSLSLTSLKSSSGAVSNGNTSTSAVSSTEAVTSAMNTSGPATKSKVPEPITKQVTPPYAATSAPMKHTTSSSGGEKARPQESKKQDTRRWIYCSDTVVRGATIEEVLKVQAYMLFYELCI